MRQDLSHWLLSHHHFNSYSQGEVVMAFKKKEDWVSMTVGELVEKLKGCDPQKRIGMKITHGGSLVHNIVDCETDGDVAFVIASSVYDVYAEDVDVDKVRKDFEQGMKDTRTDI